MVQCLAKVRDFSHIQNIQTGSGGPSSHIFSAYWGGGGAISVGLKQLEYDNDHSLPASVML
jgi:hypothetical protein